MKREELIKLVQTELSKCFEMGLRQSPTDAENSEFYRPMIDLDITPKLVDKILATQPQQPDKELFEKVYIRSEEDLPKDVGNYPVHQIGFEPDYVMSMYYNGLSDNFWMQAYDWYLRPLE